MKAVLHRLFGWATAPWQPLIVTTLLFAAFRHCRCYGNLCNQDYAVQPHPVNFLAVPQTQRVVVGDYVVFTCNFTITKLGSNYPEPHALWRVNGSSDSLKKTIPTNSDIRNGYLYSTLTIETATPSDAGFYECLAVDGHRKTEYGSEGHYIASSPQAYLHVISLEDYVTVPTETGSESGSGSGSWLEPYGTETVTLRRGEPYLIPCNVSLVPTPSHIQWFRNGTPANFSMILLDGSLPLTSATEQDRGTYQCSVQFRNHTLYGAPLEIYVSEETYSEAPRVFLDPPTAAISPGDHLTITCYVTGILSSSLRVEVTKGSRVLLRGSPSVTAPYQQFYAEGTGRYDCRLLSGDETVIATASAVVDEVLVSVYENEAVFSENDKPLVCGNSTDVEYSSIYWYKNGELLPSDAIIHRLIGNSSELEGVYQCFMYRSDIGLYQHTWRVFDYRFTNPPTNLQCDVKFSGKHFPSPRVDMTWDPPDFIAYSEIEGYFLEATNGIMHDDYHTSLSITLELDGVGDSETFEGVYEIFVKTAHSSTADGRYNSAPRRCDFNTISRALNPPLPMEASCSAEEVDFTWKNPLSRPGFDIGVLRISLNATCLYGNHSVYKFNWFDDYSEGDYDYEEKTVDSDSSHFNLTHTTFDASKMTNVNSVPRGAVCFGTGSYLLEKLQKNPITIPRKMCTVPLIEDRRNDLHVQLGLVCREKHVEMTWNTSVPAFKYTTSVTLHAVCLNSQDKLVELFSEPDAAFAGSNRSAVVDGYSLCSFYGWFTDTRTGDRVAISPAQCYVGQSSEAGFPYPPVRVPHASVYVLPPEPSTTHVQMLSSTKLPVPSVLSMTEAVTTSSPTKPAPTDPPSVTYSVAVLQIALPSAVLLVAIVTVIFVTVFLRCRQASRYSTKHLHFLVDQDFNKNYQPFNPNVMGNGISLMTIYDDGDDWVRNSPSLKVDIANIDPEKNSGSMTEEMTASLNEAETPALSPLTTEAVGEDSGCDLQFELCSTDNSHGKEHLFNRFLTGIEQGDSMSSAVHGQQQHDNSEPATEKVDEAVNICLYKEKPASSSIADLVSQRLHAAPDTTAPSSGYGTVDGYKFSTEVSEMGQEYLARKLEEVDEMAQDFVPSESKTEKIAPKSSTSSNPQLTPTNIGRREMTPELTLPHISGHEKAPSRLPPVLLTPPQSHPDATSSSLTQIPSLCALNNTTSASTGDISYGSSYYQDKEGYLHMSHTLDSGNNPHFHQSLDTLTKSL